MKLSALIDAYKKAGDQINGGKGDNTNIDSVDKKELAVGILVEKEHTSNILEAIAISLDHLTENPKYYTELIASGIVDEKGALDLAKKFGWKINESVKLNKSILRRVVKEEMAKLTEEDVSLKKNQAVASNRLKKIAAPLAKGLKKEANTYKKAVIALRNILSKRKSSPEDTKALIALTTDILWKGGIVALITMAGHGGGEVAGAVDTALPKAVVLDTLKRTLITALTSEANVELSDDELISKYIDAVANDLMKIDLSNVVEIKEFSDIESMAHYTIPVADKLNNIKESISDIHILAQEAKTFNDFAKQFAKEYPELNKTRNAKEKSELIDWLKDMFKTAKEDIGESIKEEINKGDMVIPTIGPHAGLKHRVIHVFPGGKEVNIAPIGLPANRIKYRLGAAKVNVKDLKENINKVMKEDEYDGRPKSVSSALGLKQERVVIEGDAVKAHQAEILKIVKKYDKDNKMQFYPATGKIVGALATVKIPHIKKELAGIDKGIKIAVKKQTFK